MRKPFKKLYEKEVFYICLSKYQTYRKIFVIKVIGY